MIVAKNVYGTRRGLIVDRHAAVFVCRPVRITVVCNENAMKIVGFDSTSISIKYNFASTNALHESIFGGYPDAKLGRMHHYTNL